MSSVRHAASLCWDRSARAQEREKDKKVRKNRTDGMTEKTKSVLIQTRSESAASFSFSVSTWPEDLFRVVVVRVTF